MGGTRMSARRASGGVGGPRLVVCSRAGRRVAARARRPDVSARRMRGPGGRRRRDGLERRGLRRCRSSRSRGGAAPSECGAASSARPLESSAGRGHGGVRGHDARRRLRPRGRGSVRVRGADVARRAGCGSEPEARDPDLLVKACDGGFAMACAVAASWLGEPEHARDRTDALDLERERASRPSAGASPGKRTNVTRSASSFTSGETGSRATWREPLPPTSRGAGSAPPRPATTSVTRWSTATASTGISCGPRRCSTRRAGSASRSAAPTGGRCSSGASGSRRTGRGLGVSTGRRAWGARSTLAFTRRCLRQRTPGCLGTRRGGSRTGSARAAATTRAPAPTWASSTKTGRTGSPATSTRASRRWRRRAASARSARASGPRTTAP